jgi:selenocysteine-specific elongation factor
METLGGGDIIDRHCKRIRRFSPAIKQNLQVREEGSTQEVIMALLKTKQPEEFENILTQANLTINDAHPALETLIKHREVFSIGKTKNPLLFTRLGWEQVTKKAITIVQDYHRRFPIRLGIPKKELDSRLKLGAYSPFTIQKLCGEGILIEEGINIKLPSHKIQLTKDQQEKIDTFLHSLEQNKYAPPTNLIPEPDLVNLLVKQQQVVKLSDNIIFTPSIYNEMEAEVISLLKTQGKVTLAEVRNMFSTSRKYAQAFLEYLDEKKITRRVGDERVIWRERMGVEPTEDTSNS